eukprot:jgi/Chlat1/3796/Chrsp259S03949
MPETFMRWRPATRALPPKEDANTNNNDNNNNNNNKKWTALPEAHERCTGLSNTIRASHQH